MLSRCCFALLLVTSGVLSQTPCVPPGTPCFFPPIPFILPPGAVVTCPPRRNYDDGSLPLPLFIVAELARAAYFPTRYLPRPNVLFPPQGDAIILPFKSVQVFGEARTYPAIPDGIVVSAANDLVVVAFRGTATMLDLEEDMDVSLSPWPFTNVTGTPPPLVHLGFLTRYQTVRGQVLSMVKLANASRVLVIGHSAGAALATLFTYDVVTGGVFPPSATFLATLGGPQVGNAGFAASFRNALPAGNVKGMVLVSQNGVVDVMTLFPGGDYNYTVPPLLLCSNRSHDSPYDSLAFHSIGAYATFLRYHSTACASGVCWPSLASQHIPSTSAKEVKPSVPNTQALPSRSPLWPVMLLAAPVVGVWAMYSGRTCQGRNKHFYHEL